MADPINDIVQVSITANSKTPSRLGFGVPVIMTYHTRFADEYRIYSDTASMVADGFTTYDDAYRIAARVFAQNPTVTQVVVGRLASAPAFVTRVTITSAVQGQKVQFKVIQPETGLVTQIDHTIGAAATTTTVATAVELLTEAVAGVDSTSATANVDLVPTVAGRKVHVYDCVNCQVSEETAAAGYDTALTSLQLSYDDFYFVLIGSASKANITAVAAWTESAGMKMFLANTHDSLAYQAGSTGAALQTAAYTRTALLYTRNSHEFAAAGWAAIIGAQDPGTITAALKTISGVSAYSETSTVKTGLESFNVNHYMPIRSINMTRPGKLAVGEWIDVRHGMDALTADLQESVFALLANSGKVPMTPAGLDIIQNVILGVLRRFEGTDDQPGLIAPKTSKVIMPAFSSISTADKNARQLKNVRFSGTLAGAIHFASLVGTLSNA